MEQIRRSHNLVKRHLIQKVIGNVSHPINVLDVGCGCGGDLRKWFSSHSNIYLDMCDPSKESLDEAVSRIDNIQNVKNDRVRTFHGDIFSCPLKKYDFICYNFSLHYIFENAKLFFRSLEEIKKRLKKGGKLFGCIPDSEQILLQTPFSDNFGNFFARNNENTGFGNFGEKVHVFLADTPYYNDGPKPEPIAYKDLLVTHLELKGIYLEHWKMLDTQWNISSLYSEFIFVHK